MKKRNIFLLSIVIMKLSLCTLTLYGQSQQKISNFDRISSELKKYNFVFNSWLESELPFLMGNNEMGGLADKSGTGFPFMWFADVWKHPSARTSLLGFKLSNKMLNDKIPDEYGQSLDISNGILNTVYGIADQSYEAQMFVSMHDRHLMALKISNTGRKTINWDIVIPGQSDGFQVTKKNGSELNGITVDSLYSQSIWNIENHRAAPLDSFYTKVKWTLNTDKKIIKKENDYSIELLPDESAIFVYSVVTNWDEKHLNINQYDLNRSVNNYNDLKTESINEWRQLYNNTAAIVLPEGDYARLFYRTIYSLFSTSGSKHFLPGETQFGSLKRDIGHVADRSFSNCLWDMNAFTYGAAGWCAMAYTTLGNEDMAANMLNWFYQPESLKKNVRSMFPIGDYTLHYRGDTVGDFHYRSGDNINAMAFGHETKTNMENYNWFGDGSHVDWQLHYNAFASSIFHQFTTYFPNKEYMQQTTYPLLKGIAEMWCELINWDEELNQYVLPGLVSLTEDLVAENLLDAAISAKWNLIMAARYADDLNKDKGLREKWKRIANSLYIPQNDVYYLEFLNDKGNRHGGGYQGIRGMVYLTYPTRELISEFDMKKINRTLDHVWERNYSGGDKFDNELFDTIDKPELDLEQVAGMITFIANWYALAEAYAGRGNNAYETSSYCLEKLDAGGNVLYETDNLRPYYLDSYASFSLVPAAMLVQSYNDTIKVFPAVPDKWDNISFYDLPAEYGVRVSGKMSNGLIDWITLTKGGKVLTRVTDKNVFLVKSGRRKIKIDAIR